jgi:Flp pilus assembly protein TadG
MLGRGDERDEHHLLDACVLTAVAPGGVRGRAAPAPRRGAEGGQALVEFALVLPLLVLLLLGIVQFGQLFGAYLDVLAAARVGARAAALGASASAAEAVATQAADAMGRDLEVAVTGTSAADGGWAAGSPVTCRVTYQAPVAVPLFWPLLGRTFALEGATVMLAEGGGP